MLGSTKAFAVHLSRTLQQVFVARYLEGAFVGYLHEEGLCGMLP